MKQLVITAVGPDRPGIVDQLTEALAGCGANIADSRMANLRGEFAIILLAETPAPAVDQLTQTLPELGDRLGLTVMCRPAAERPPAAAERRGVPYRVHVYAMDQAGLVHRVTHVLHQQNVNIEELRTQLTHGPHTGTPLFSMDMVVTLSAETPLRAVRRELESLCDGLNCDLVMQPA